MLGRYAGSVNGIAKIRMGGALSLLIAATLLPTTAATQSPVAKLAVELRSKEIGRRLKAIDDVVATGDPTAERVLQPLLRDKDWEVQEQIATALGKLKSKGSLAKLADLAIDGDIVRIRRAAALAAANIDAAEAAKRIFKKAKSKKLVRALEALAIVLRAKPEFKGGKKLAGFLKDKDAAVREAATAVWLESSPDRKKAIEQLTAARHLTMRCRALDTITEAPREEDLDPLLELFAGKGDKPVIARRIVRAVAAVIAMDGDRKSRLATVLAKTEGSEVALTRRARLIAHLGVGEKPVMTAKDAVAALKPCMRSDSDRPRGAAAKTLREIGGKEALKAALGMFNRETGGRVQLQLVETVAALRKPDTEKAVQWLVKIVEGNYDEQVRERAVVRLGKSGVKGATKTLSGALTSQEWTIAVCAAVSLGKTDSDDAYQPLIKLLGHSDWKMRGAAVVGLMHWSRDEAVDPIVKMLEDENPVVSRAAHEALRTMSRNFEADFKPTEWRKWWTANRKKHDFTDREATLGKLKKYGYAVPDTEIYSGLDVVVYQTGRGDHIELLLERLKIAHRTTQQGKVTECGVHPEAIFVSNCTGILGPDDVEPLQWFVRTGGSLFGSCWALSETIARVHPGVMKMYATGEVLDDVRAQACRPDSPLLTGVFPPSVVPVYHLEGAHLIQVLDPDRCEVLIDSPDAAERHGCGNLAAWFFSGHGVLFDSANHFDLQGLSVAGAGKLKKPKERQAYAVDHLGMSLATWREARSEGYWKSSTKAGQSVPDMSAFRLLTNFVRSKRIGDY